MTTSELTTGAATATNTVDVTAQPVRWPVALLGGFVASFGISGLLDDSGLIEHPWWSVLIAAVIAGCLLAIVTTMRSLARSPQRPL